MEIQHGIVTKIYPTDCAYDEVIVEDRIVAIGASAGSNLNFKKITLPNSITELQDYAFLDCKNLEEIDLPKSLASIGERCFAGCSSLKKIDLHEGITHIGASAFADCESLEEITLPSTITEISYRALAGCKNLKKINIPSSVTAIGWAAFADCESLEEIVIPESVKGIGYQLFLNCKNLKNPTLPSSISKLPEETFYGCESLADYDLPKNFTSIGESAFQNCKNLTTFPEHATEFGISCFEGCSSLESADINENVTNLADEMFRECVKLKEVTSKSKKIEIGRNTFNYCKSLEKVPDFVCNYPIGSFQDCISLEEVNIEGTTLGEGAFADCTSLKRVNNSDKLTQIDTNAFKGCVKLEDFVCSSLLTSISKGTFQDCVSLKTIKLPSGLLGIGKKAFKDCESLKTIEFPDTLEKIGDFAFQNCKSIKKLYIPANLKDLGNSAFSYMSSLERFDVSPDNKEFLTRDNLSLMNARYESLVQYAIGCKNKEYSILPYAWRLDFANRDVVRQTNSIKENAFSGAEHLEILTLDTSVDYLEVTAFKDTPKLKTLNVRRIPFFSTQGFRAVSNGHYDFDDGDFPFETVNLDDRIIKLHTNAYTGFKNLRKVNIPIGASSVESFSFGKCPKLLEVIVPNNICQIDAHAFNKNTLLRFENGLAFNPGDLAPLTTKKKAKIYTTKNKEYYIEKNGCIVKITEDEIKDMCRNYQMMLESPEIVLEFKNLMFKHGLKDNFLMDGIIMSSLSTEESTMNFKEQEDYDNDEKKYVLEKPSGTTKEEYEGEAMEAPAIPKVNPAPTFENIEDLHAALLKITENIEMKPVTVYDLPTPRIRWYINEFLEINKSEADIFLSCFDANMKRMIQNSLVLENMDTAVDNMKDLLKLAKVLGCFEKDKRTRQRACNFLTEKVFRNLETENGVKLPKIVGDDIHRRFPEFKPRKYFEPAFANFFMENYLALAEHELTHNGFIARTYNAFPEIVKTHTSDHGAQRKLKVTFEKCRHYLATHKFANVTKETEHISELLGDWFDDNLVFELGVEVYNQAKLAPRNIFTQYEVAEINDEVLLLFDDKPENDLKEELSENYSYEWLPKQDINNLVLGKFCDCCAHVSGAGKGIMKTSMTSPHCQNLVVRNSIGEIIGKSTISLNRENGYAVFNNVESRATLRTDEDLKKIYNAFMRGAEAFLKKYNENNPDKQIKTITIGTTRNALNVVFNEKEKTHPIVDVLPINAFDGYAGDARKQQRLVLKI